MAIPRPEGPLSQLLAQLGVVWDYLDALSGGDVVGPSSSINDRIAVFDGTTGKLLKVGSATIAEIVAGSGGLVTSVFGRTGNIVAATNDYTWAQIDKSTSSLADLTTRSATDLTSGTLAAARMPALTGDVTTSAGAVATTIANNAVSLAKMADIATASFLGRNTGGTGDPEVLSIATAKTMLNLTGTNSGDVTLAGENYLSIAGQVITANAVNLAGTNVTGTLTVNKGGTGTSTFTTNGVLYGNTTSAIQVTAQGAANTVLIANAGAPSFSAAPVIGTSITVPLITTLSSGNLTIAPTGSVTFDPTGNQIDPLTNYDLNLGQLSKKYLTLHAAELWVETLVAQDTVATIGGRILVGPTTVLTSDLASAATSIVVKHNQMISGDRVYLESNGKVEFLAITSAPSGTGPYTYTVTRNLDGTGANDWFAGDAVFNTGQTGNGFIDLYSVRGVKTSSQVGPTIVGNVRNSSTYNDWSERWAIGNLNGLYGYGTNIYGVAMGVPTAAWVKIDPTNGVRIGHNATTLTQIDASGNASFTGSITAASGSIAGWTIDSTRLSNGTTYIASGFDIPAPPVAWFGRTSTNVQGMLLQDSASRLIAVLVNGNGLYPAMSMYDGTRFRVVLGGLNHTWGSDGATNSMGMKIWNSSGTKIVEFSDVQNIISGWTIGQTKISSTGIDIHSGASAALAFGTTPPTSASAGTGIWLDRTGLFGLASSTVQIKVDASNGKLIAGASLVALGANGVEIVASTAKTSRDYRFVDALAGDYLGGTHCIFNAGSPAIISMVLEANSDTDTTGVLINCNGGTSKIEFKTSTTAGGARDNILINGGMAIGAVSPQGVGTLNTSGDIYKNSSAFNNPDFVLEHWATGKIEKFADKEGAATYKGLRPLSEVREFVRSNFHLPGFGQKAGHGLFSGSEQLLLTVEQMYLHIFELEQQIKELKGTQ